MLNRVDRTARAIRAVGKSFHEIMKVQVSRREPISLGRVATKRAGKTDTEQSTWLHQKDRVQNGVRRLELASEFPDLGKRGFLTRFHSAEISRG